jgi:hypothetical protein
VLPPTHVKRIEGVPTTSVARTLCDLAAVIHPDRVERTLDTALASRLVTVPAVWRVLDDLPRRGRKGTGVVRALLAARGEGYVAPASELEQRVLELLREAGLPAPAREIDLGDSDGWVGRVELVYRDAKVLIEADSRRHDAALVDFESDRARHNRLVATGWRILRITWAMTTQQPELVAAQVGRALTTAVA